MPRQLRKHLIQGSLTVLAVSPLLSWRGSWQPTGAGAVAESFTVETAMCTYT